jgi:hypothetical protein
MKLAWGSFSQNTTKWLKTGWLITAGLVAFYAGAIQPRQGNQGIASQRTGLGEAQVEWDAVSLWQAPVYDRLLRSVDTSSVETSSSGVVGGVPQRTRIVAQLEPQVTSIESLKTSEPKAQADDDRKLVRNGSMDLIVQHPHDTAEAIRQLAARMGGFLVASDVAGEKNAPFATLTIRVPAARFEEARAQIRQLGLRVESEKLQAQDGTRQYVDQAARLRNLRAQETQYLGILKQAKTVKDTLAVSDKLNEVRGGIEQQQAEFDALSKQVETVSLTLTLRAEADAQVFGLHRRPLYQLKLAAREGLEAVADYSVNMVGLFFYLPATLLWLVTILSGAALGWRILRWAGHVFFGFRQAAAPSR